MALRRMLPALLIAAALAACGENAEKPSGPAAVDEGRLVAADAEPGNWMSTGRTYSEQRYSPLDRINAANVPQLSLAWYHDLDTTRGIEATPIVVDGVMYTTSAWSIVYALDAATGKLLWSYDPEVPKEWSVHACCDVVNRGPAVWKGKVYVGTLDGRLVALDAARGKPKWDVNTIDRSQPYTITGAPRVVKGKVIIGNAGADMGVRGYVSAYDAETGGLAWRFYTVPGHPADVFESDILKEAAQTWTGEWWTLGGGGTVYDSMAYDPELDLLYVGVGNGSPWNQQLRSPDGGDNLFLASIVALDPDTGAYAWHYQTTPGETWDYTATQHMILADLTIDGQVRKVIMQAPKNGFFYVLDRATGAFISARNFVPVTWAKGIDPATGRPIEAEGARFTSKPALVSPSPLGAHNWQPMAYSPKTGLVYIPAMELGSLYKTETPFKVYPGRYNTGTDMPIASLPDEEARRKALKPLLKARLSAWNPVTQTEAWSVAYDSPWNGGLLATAGGLVFQGTADGRLVAYKADDGGKLWEAPAQTGVMAAPVTYEAGGEQYVSVMAGWGGAFGIGAGYFAPDTAKFRKARVLTFKLGGTAKLPPLEMTAPPPPDPPPQTASAETVARGQALFHRLCHVCHGDAAVGSGVVPDLRWSANMKDEDAWRAVVLDGAMKETGMAGFGQMLNGEDAEAIRAYIVRRAHETRDGKG
ncbi:MAG: PQQ-dependent dehydrogenase, methanol/ethanol family [Sphingomonadales bacterium]